MDDTASSQRTMIDFKTDYYGTLKLIDWFDIDRIRAARVMVIGAGAIGNEVLKNLALLGVGNVYIFDRDTIEISNLSRSVLYRTTDRDQPKASTAARGVRELNGDVNVQWQEGDIRFDLGLGLLRRMDVIIGCLDNREARLKINSDCMKVGRPWIDAGIGQLNGQVRVFQPGSGACYECSFTDEDYQQVAMPCNRLASMYAAEGKIPTTPTIASIVAGVQVQEALKLLDIERWQGRTLAGREFIFNGTVGDVSISVLPEREECPAHTTFEADEIIELPDAQARRTTVAELLSMVRDRLGETASIELNFELSTGIKCSACNSTRQVFQPVAKLFQEQLICERCGREGQLITTNKLGGPATTEVGELMAAKLSDLNIPALDILAARNADGVELYFELTGDADEILRFPHSHQD